MKQYIEAKFGDCRFATSAKVTASPTEENELHVLLIDLDCAVKTHLLYPLPKGTVKVTNMLKVPPKCPNCQYELWNMGIGHYEVKTGDSFTYNGVTAELIPSYDENVIELKLHYETVTYDSGRDNPQG